MGLWHQVQGVASGLTTNDRPTDGGLAPPSGQRGPSYAKGCADTRLGVVARMTVGRPTSISRNAMLMWATMRLRDVHQSWPMDGSDQTGSQCYAH